MARFEDGCYGSMPGVALIGKVLAGRCGMRYTRVAAGKGEIPEGETPKTMTAPAGYVMDAVISAVTNPVDGECQVTVQINSAQVETGFYCTGLLLYAEDPDLGEVPYTYLNLENEPEWIRPASSLVGKLATFDIIAAVGDVDTVTAFIDPEAIATNAAVEQRLLEHDSDPNAHAGLIEQAVTQQVQSMAESGELVTEEKLDALVKAEVAKKPGGGYYGTYVLTIPQADWRAAETPNPDYEFVCDVAETDVTSEMVPTGACAVGYFDSAGKAGLVNGCETFDGYIRFMAKRMPDADIQASITLFSKGGGNGVTGTGIGAGLTYDDDGLLTVNAGEGLTFDELNALTVSKETVLTGGDLVDEDAAQQSIQEILSQDET